MRSTVCPTRAGLSCQVLRDLQESIDNARRTLPLCCLLVQLLSPGAGQRIHLDAPAAFGLAPSGRYPPKLFELDECRVQSALIECELIAADLLDAPRDPVPVEGSQRLEGLEDHQAETAVQDVVLFSARVGVHMLEAYTFNMLAVNVYECH